MGKLRIEPKKEETMRDLAKSLLSELRRIRRQVRYRNQLRPVLKPDKYEFNAFLVTVNEITSENIDPIEFGIRDGVNVPRPKNAEYLTLLDKSITAVHNLFKNL